MQIKIEKKNGPIAGDRPQIFIVGDEFEFIVGPHADGQIIVWRLDEPFADDTTFGSIVAFEEGMTAKGLMYDLEYADHVFAEPSKMMRQLHWDLDADWKGDRLSGTHYELKGY